MKIFSQFWGLALLSFLVFSCKPQQNINYVQDIDSKTIEALVQNQNKLQKGDILVITVMSKDVDVVKPFNQNYSSGQMSQITQNSGNMGAMASTLSGPSYRIDTNGYIDFPVLGKLEAYGKTIDEFKEELRIKLKRYIKEPTLSVEHSNFKVSVMGEVNRPGEYIITDAKGTLLSAISLAGDLTIYGMRDEIRLIRMVDGQVQQTKIDLTKADFINSPYYTLKQGDVIYVPANQTRQKVSRLDPNTTIYISVASVIIGLLAIFVR